MRVFIRTAHLFLAAAFLSAAVSAQSEDADKGAIKGGVLNGTAISLPKPTYPSTALALGVGGSVTVQLLISENGDVIFAAAVSGHPLLRPTAVAAARRAKFTPTLLSGKPLKVSGVINYNFVAPPSMLRTGYELGAIERSSNASYHPHKSFSSIITEIPNEGAKAELRSLLEPLKTEQPNEPAGGSKKYTSNPPSAKRTTASSPSDYTGPVDGRFTVQGTPVVRAGPKMELSAEGLLKLGPALNKAEERMLWTENGRWYFRFGRLIGHATVDNENGKDLAPIIAELQEHATNAPAKVSAQVAERLSAITDVLALNISDEEKCDPISRNLESLRRLRVN